MIDVTKLGYEQIKALQILNDRAAENIEASALCDEAGCAWYELFALSELGLVNAGMERLERYQVHPVITDSGREALKEANKLLAQRKE
jgi:hypothetical protein